MRLGEPHRYPKLHGLEISFASDGIRTSDHPASNLITIKTTLYTLGNLVLKLFAFQVRILIFLSLIHLMTLSIAQVVHIGVHYMALNSRIIRE